MACVQAYHRPELRQYLSAVSHPFEVVRQRAFGSLDEKSMFARVLFKCATEVLKRSVLDVTLSTNTMMRNQKDKMNRTLKLIL